MHHTLLPLIKAPGGSTGAQTEDEIGAKGMRKWFAQGPWLLGGASVTFLVTGTQYPTLAG